MRKLLSDSEIINLYNSGKTPKEIAFSCGVTSTPVYKVLGKTRSRSRTIKISTYSLNHTIQETCEEYKCTKAAVYTARSRYKNFKDEEKKVLS